MSTEQEDRVADHATTDDLIVGGGGPRRIWKTMDVAPDPGNTGKFYVVQELAGEWGPLKSDSQQFSKRQEELLAKKSPGHYTPQEYLAVIEELGRTVVWLERSPKLPPVTRVLYCELDERGIMQNVNREKSQGAGGRK
jgi:hypothetical protein